MNAAKKISLNGNDWKMKEFVGMDWVWRDSVKPDTGDVRWWYPATVPGSVMHDLAANGLIPDPHYECNTKLGTTSPQNRSASALPASIPGWCMYRIASMFG